MRRLKGKYEKPKEPWSEELLSSEREVMKKYGLRRKKELWRAQATLTAYKNQAKHLIAKKNDKDLAAKKNEKKQAVLFEKIRSVGLLETPTLDDILALSIDNLLARRLQSFVLSLNLAKTHRGARQAIVHGHVRIDGKKVTFPSYTVKTAEEGKITTDKS